MLDLEMGGWQLGRVTAGRKQQQLQATGASACINEDDGPTSRGHHVPALSGSSNQAEPRSCTAAADDLVPAHWDASPVMMAQDLVTTTRGGGMTGHSGSRLVERLSEMTMRQFQERKHASSSSSSSRRHHGHIRFGCLAVLLILVMITSVTGVLLSALICGLLASGKGIQQYASSDPVNSSSSPTTGGNTYPSVPSVSSTHLDGYQIADVGMAVVHMLCAAGAVYLAFVNNSTISNTGPL
ncbi:hypothetical protein CEUSTIGMA_g9020.t1 [Chlamydomonas eustigma]|uniref:Transmembrane protein n=1 Tax=Chlamydomonas eustigma TaxID=1157962 RepID=A0A250XFB4_9CHLO|nr:hypothetical protein CEUSTIGMA_g9020.t1 [Chlamydomonas eustigma]|eukprot:GAX81592.1 hypothetical protein CEUSTIGMA_g9020.t1 [Chlamydomonas eustigma]